MENHCVETKESKLLKHLGNLRKMMVHNHELDNLSEFVLHDLCKPECFNLNKAAYFVNNPDFRCLQGISGYHDRELKSISNDSWNDQKKFISVMQNSEFNQQVRKKCSVNFEKGTSSELYTAQKLADELEIDNPQYFVWDLKYANHGLFIYEAPKQQESYVKDNLFDSLHHFSFCPVFSKA